MIQKLYPGEDGWESTANFWYGLYHTWRLEYDRLEIKDTQQKDHYAVIHVMGGVVVDTKIHHSMSTAQIARDNILSEINRNTSNPYDSIEEYNEGENQIIIAR